MAQTTITSNALRSAAYFDRIAEQYDTYLTAFGGDRWARGAFRQLVTEHIRPGATLLDFGCGTGMDALWYAEQGYRVIACDNSEGMLGQLRRRCAQEIKQGRVTPVLADEIGLAAALDGQSRPDAVVANFAVLDVIEDKAALFSRFAEVLTSDGIVIVSLFNPFFWKDMRRRTWWATSLRSFGRSYVHFSGDGLDAYRHRISALKRAARPSFAFASQAGVGALIRYYTGDHVWGSPRTLAERLEARWWRRFPLRALGRYIFVVLRKVR